MSSVLIESIVMGLVFSILTIGVVITFKILDFPDMSVEGTFPLGAFVFAKMLTIGINPIISMVAALLAGAVGGYITYVLYRKINIQAILAGILTMTFLYSVNLRITGTPNVTFFDYKTVFQLFESVPKIVILAIIGIIIKLAIDWFLKTEKGYLLLATGDNETLVKSLGKNPNKYVCTGLMISNALAALAGSLMAQSNGYADITMGQSIIVSALASIVIGDAFLKNVNALNRTTRAIIGAVIYRIIYGIALYIGLAPSDLKGITAVIVVAFLIYNNISSKGLSVLKEKREENVKN
ncbi:ABC transporter permease [Peptoniphilus sp. MSJ-1]|uniref:ABC transporter permease n=1 Tax=Peptoniphilus ovalis TaxID=2841503 RepID=A0ABS6FIT4_9FIRM|nr:ABC transporter permease [Peptoniphilus ovalis]MBU5670088.1 ABC transporter permease [Peptoniphilus ovalis]